MRRRHLDDGIEQFGDGIKGDQPVTVLAEDRVVPHRVFNRQAHEPAEQQVTGILLDEQSLTANAVQHLQHHSSHQFLRSPAFDIGLVHRREAGIHTGQGFVKPNPDRSQQMIGGNEASSRMVPNKASL